MKFILIFGPPAVGKMSVGQELEKITELKLFHNHMTIELVAPFFDFGTSSFRSLVDLFRIEMFKEVASSNLPGLIFTYVWDFSEEKEQKKINEFCEIFESKGGIVYFVELEAEIKERLKRNKHPHRLKHKPTKRNIEESDKRLKEMSEKYRLNSKVGEIKEKNYLKINNTNLTPSETAKIIVKQFNF